MSKLRKKIESQIATESNELCSPKFPPADPSTIPFEEWNDGDIEMEKWEISEYNDEAGLFKDPQLAHLPPSLHGVQWKRPCEVFPDAHFTVFIDNPAIPNLIGGSKHLLYSQFVRHFIYSVETLCYLGSTGAHTVEYSCPQFCPTTGNHPWRPWHHVYSRCGAGKGQRHNPTVNKSGKYIIRLFWLGFWKKIYVDDLLPLNAADEVLLPSLPIPKDAADAYQAKQVPHEKHNKISRTKVPSGAMSKSKSMTGSKVIELWPFLLAKALMKVANLTWCDGEDLVDFDIIQCLSGWIPHMISTRGIAAEEIWDTCMKYTSHYMWQDHKDRSTSKLNQPKSRSKLKESPRKNKKVDSSESKDDHTKYSITLCFRHANCSIAGCDKHCLLIEQTRNVSLVKPTKEEDFPLWKRYRWLDWAIENNILPPKESVTPIKCLKLVDPFRDVCNDIYGDKYPTERDNEDTRIHNIFVKEESGRVMGRKGNESKRTEFGLQLNLTRWLDFEQIFGNIVHLIVYSKPSKFPVKVRISDLSGKTISKEYKYPILKTLEDSMMVHEWKEIIKPQSLLYYKNEPLYVLSDSLSSRRVVIDLAHVGSAQVLLDDTKNDTEEELIEASDSECGICLSTILERLKKKNEVPIHGNEKNMIRVTPNEYRHRLEGHLVVCKFKWNSDHVDDVVQSFRTYGTSSMVLNLEPGRRIFRLFIKTGTSYVTQILSDSPLCVGYLEEIYPLMTEETCLVNNMKGEVVKSFQDLIKSFGKEDFLEKLRHFYDSYKPSCQLDKEELLTIHETFYAELCSLIAKNLGEPELKALSVLLKQWQFPLRNYNAGDTSGFCYEPGAEDSEYVEKIEKAAVVIQAFLRGVYERQMMKRHSSGNKHHKTTVDCLQHVQSLLASEGISLLRLFFNHNDVANITGRRKCGEDIQNAISLYQFSNSVRLSDQGWNLICRQVFYVTALRPIIISINLFCDLDRYSVRVFENDCGSEMKIDMDNVLVDRYRPNSNGYTVLCCGISSAVKQLHYKLVYVLQKETDEKLLHFPHNQIKNEVVAGNYIPSRKNRICRYILLVQSEQTLATIQFSTDYPNVIINMKLLKYDEVLTEVTGRGSVLMPVVILGTTTHDQFGDYCKKIFKEESVKSIDKKTSSKGLHKSRIRSHSNSIVEDKDETYINEVYFLEASVLEDSWPLTCAEWKVVKSLLADKLWGGPDRNKRMSSTIKKQSLTSVQSPYWTLQIITGYGDVLRLSRDEKRDMELRHIKIRWNDNDPTRYQKSEEQRNAFISEHKISNEEICLDKRTRSLNPDIFEEEVLPTFESYCNMYKKIPLGADASKRVLKDNAKIEQDVEDEFRQIVRFREYIEKATQILDDTETSQIENYNMMVDWYNGCRLDSERMMEDAHKAKQKYIEKVSEPTAVVNKKDKKGKKSPKKAKKT